MTSGMKHKLAALVLAGLGVAAAGVVAITPVSGATQPDEGYRGPPERSLTVIPLKHTSVREFSSAAHSIAEGPYSSISYDERTNSVIMLGTEEDTDRIQDLVKLLDVEVGDAPSDDHIEVYPLEHAAANGQLISTLSEVLRPTAAGPALRLSIESATNQLVARGSSSMLADLAGVLEELDRPARYDQSSAEINVRLIWLTSAAEDDVPPDMGDVTDALEEVGISGLGMAGQTIIRTTDRTEFKSEFIVGQQDPWFMQMIGHAMTQEDGDWSLRISINGRQSIAQDGEIPGSIEFETGLSTSAGHFVVLGVAPIKEIDSVFVLQVMETD